MTAVAFLHAHPDDEAIFTGGTMARLADTGVSVVLVLATGGELGGDHAVRVAEADAAARLLGVERVIGLGYRDSGMEGDPANDDVRSLWQADVAAAARDVAAACTEAGASCLVTYDDHGVYGHPDHIRCHEIGARAAALAGMAHWYEVTVDREDLHFVETHLVAEAALADGDLGIARSRIGLPSVEITTVVDVASVLERKRAAMAAHASQIPETGSALAMAPEAFAGVYGREWYRRSGPPGPLEALGASATGRRRTG